MGKRSKERRPRRSIEEVEAEMNRNMAAKMLRQMKDIEELDVRNRIAETQRLKEKANGQADRS